MNWKLQQSETNSFKENLHGIPTLFPENAFSRLSTLLCSPLLNFP